MTCTFPAASGVRVTNGASSSVRFSIGGYSVIDYCNWTLDNVSMDTNCMKPPDPPVRVKPPGKIGDRVS